MDNTYINTALSLNLRSLSADPIFEENKCRARVPADCTGDTPVLDGNGSCRARIAADCNTDDLPVLDSQSKECRARVASDCTSTEVFETGVCRAKVETDCTSKEVFENADCRPRVSADCTGDTPVLDATSKECRARVAADCSGETGTLDATSKECRATVDTDCVDPTPIFVETYCRARVASDCTDPAAAKFDETTKTCVASISCSLEESDIAHPGQPGDCGTTLAGGATCLPVCEAGLAPMGAGLSCSETGVLTTDFSCQLVMTLGMSGVSKVDFDADTKLTETFITTVADVSGEKITIAEISGVVAADGTCTADKCAAVTFKIMIAAAGEQATIKAALEAAVADGIFTTKYKESLKANAVESISVDDITADQIEQAQDEPGEMPSNDAGGTTPGGSDGDSGNVGMYAAVAVCVLAVVAALVWYFKCRKVPDNGTSKMAGSTPIKAGIGLSDVELEGPTDIEGKPVTTSDGFGTTSEGAQFT